MKNCKRAVDYFLAATALFYRIISDSQITAINLEDGIFRSLKEPEQLYDYVCEKLDPDHKNYVFLDEVQQIPNFQKAVDWLYMKKNIDLYATGSNAYLLSGELATLLSGRYVEIKMLPLSFKEYVSAFPENSNPSMLESIIEFIFDNIGNLCSTTKIANSMTSAGRKISVPTVESYLHVLRDSFILYKAERYDIKGKQYLSSGSKYYIADIGLRYYLLGSRQSDHGHILENIVYLELLRRGCRVYIGKTGDAEVDFIAMDSDSTSYYQVAQTVMDKHTLKRELAPLESIHDHNPKYLLTIDFTPPTSCKRHPANQRSGVAVAVKFLITERT